MIVPLLWSNAHTKEHLGSKIILLISANTFKMANWASHGAMPL